MRIGVVAVEREEGSGQQGGEEKESWKENMSGR